ncbi:MAG: hypothetical protein H7257_01735 [Taibaiella sp.]|nr:hypothetical protein [Taibaiella sp.]
MEFPLLCGRFTADETEHLIGQFVKVKTEFHRKKIELVAHSENEIRHSEKRIKELEEKMNDVIELIKSGGYKHVAINARLIFEFCPDNHNV